MGRRRGWILILGGGVMQLPAIAASRKLGLRVAVADGNAAAPGVPLSERFFHTDLKDLDGLLGNAKSLAESGSPLEGVFTAGTDFAFAVAWLCDALGLPGHSYDAALKATEKHRMREALSAAGVPVPPFLSVSESSEVTVTRALGELGLPLVVKPVDSMGARGVRKIGSVEELPGAIDCALGLSRSRRAILEAVIPGRELSLDALVWDRRIVVTGVADRHIRFEPYFIEIGHTMPTELPEGRRTAVEETFKQGIRALGLTHGAAKGDIFLGPQGPVVGEIAARLSGGYMSGWTYPYASGIELTEAAIRLAVGEEPQLPERPREKMVCSERAVISLPGRIASVAGLEEARAEEGLRELFWKVEVGDDVSFPRNNVEKCGNVISVGKSREESRRRAERALDHIRVRLEPGRRETWEWLFGASTPASHWAFPPVPEAPGLLEGMSLALPTRERGLGWIDPEALGSGGDWHGRELAAVVHTLMQEYGLREVAVGEGGLEALFWQAVVRGSLQGGAFVLDTIREYPERLRTWLDDIISP